ncbi:hypothetical protein LINGRAPRIM_LOCUS2356 [Linum grandiflorum]
MFLSETTTTRDDVVSLFHSFRYLPHNNIVVNCNNERAGGLALAWSTDHSPSILHSSLNYLIAKTIFSPNINIILVCVYLPCDSVASREILHELFNILQPINLPIIVFGDFKVVSDSSEKQGGSLIRPISVEYFRAFISNLGLYELGFSGQIHTWSNRARDITRLIHCRLDRFLLSNSRLITYPNLRVSHLTDLGLDRRLIYLTLQPLQSASSKCSFRFDNRRLSNSELPPLVNRIWATPFIGSKLFILHSKFKALRHALHSWQ